MFRKPSSLSLSGRDRRGRWFPRLLIGVSVPMLLLLITAAVFIFPKMSSHAAAAVNMNCSLIVPANPLSAQGLATPYQLVATNPANGACHEANNMQAAFVQGAVLDPMTGTISVYNPLVIDQGTQPAVPPTAPTFPAGAVVALWFGSQGMQMTLQGTNNSLQQGQCVNGAQNSVFGQFAYCNAPAFFAAANQAIGGGTITVPPLGKANDGQTCPSVRDFSLVDMDQSDNVTTQYLITANGQTAQLTAANKATLQNTQVQVNASDNRLLAVAVDGALGCQPWTAPDLADPGQMVPALPLNELQAAAQQAAPIALVPAGDPMVLNNNQIDLNKVNSYRRGVDQQAANTPAQASTTVYCNTLLNVGPARLQLDKQMTLGRPSPDMAVANTLFTFLAQRFAATFGPNGLNCQGLLNQPNPVTVTTNGNGVAVDATITVPNGAGGTGNGTGIGNGNGVATTGNGNVTGNGNGNGNTQVNCVVNGTTVAGCMGTTMIAGQPCMMAQDVATHHITMTCPPAAQQQTP